MHGLRSMYGDAGIDLRGREIGVAEHLLHVAEVGATLVHQRGRRVAPQVAAAALADPGLLHRKRRGLTQAELGERVGLSNRIIAHSEREDAQPPGPILRDLARALGVTTDELLGMQLVEEETSPKTSRLLKRLRKIEELPPADQRAVLKFLDTLLETRAVA
jgi:transcriptional regulator with XRE-family HTH domain